MSPDRLYERFERIDGLLESIAEAEATLDPLLGGEVSSTLVTSFPPAVSRKAMLKDEGELARLLSERIAAKRRALGWRQEDLAKATGIARPNIARLESGRRIPKISTLQRIAQALNITVEEMMV